MKNRILISIVIVVLAALIAVPASAQDPEPTTVPIELEESGVVRASGGGLECSPDMAGEGKEPSMAPDLSTVTADDRPELSSYSETTSELAGTGTITIYGWTNLLRDQASVSSQAWSSATSAVNYMCSGNYLCKNGSCTAWYYYSGYNIRWVRAGWTWRESGSAAWYSRSQHYFRSGSTTRTLYTSIQAYF